MAKYKVEQVYSVTYYPERAEFFEVKYFIASSIEDAIEMCKDLNRNCRIKAVEVLCNKAFIKCTKTITIDV